MSTPEARAAFLSIKRRKHCPREETLQLYAPRRPMTQLPDKYRVTKANPEPPLVHFAIPVDMLDLYKYADKHDLMKCYRQFSNVVSPASVILAAEYLSEEVEYQLEFGWPFAPTADCGVILSLYDNYTIRENMLIDEDQEDVIEMVQEELGLDKSVRPKWYFDQDDPWRPGYSDEEERA